MLKIKNDDFKNALIGFGAGLAVAIGGAVKDSPYEGFELDKFFRSPAVGAAVGVVVGRLWKTNNPYGIFLMTIGGERIVVESYKIARAHIPAKFKVGEWGKEKCCKCPESDFN